MKLKLSIALMLVFVGISPLLVCAKNNLAPSFFEVQALSMIFGNYDNTHQISIWENIKFSTKEDEMLFWGKKTGIVSSVLFQQYEEAGKGKVFLVTKTTPVGSPFDCHACLPLLSAAVLVYENGDWRVESKNLFLTHDGEYGMSPKAKLVSMKNNKHGVLLEFEHSGNGVTRERVLLIPKKKTIMIVRN